MAREMRQFKNASLTAGRITVTLVGATKSRYHATGWALVNGEGNVEIYGEDQRRTKPLMVIPADQLGGIDIELLG